MSETGNIQPDALARALGIDPSVLSYIALQNNASNFSTLPVGISGATAGNVFNPETMFLTGAFNPSSLQSAIDSTHQQMLADYQAKVDRAISRPYDATLGSIGLDETFYNPNTEIGELMQDAVDSIAAGEQTAAGALDVINKLISSGQVPAEVADSIGRIGDDLKTFEDKDLPRYRDAVKKYEYDAAQAMANLGVTEPTRQDAKVKFYSSIGTPQMALLPDPSEQYQIDPFIFAKPEEAKRRQDAIAKAEETIASETAKFSKQLSSKNLGTQLRGLTKILDKANQVRLEAEAGVKVPEQSTWSKIWNAPVVTGALSKVYGVNKFVSPPKAPGAQQRKDAGMAAVQQFLASPEAGRLVPQKSVYDLSPAAKAARDEKLKNEMYLRIVEGITKPKAAAAQAALTKAGITPWSQAMNQMLLNAQAMSTKK